MAIWPASLPQHWLLASNEETSDRKAVVHTEMETGPRMSRQRYDADIRPFTAELYITGAERTTFDTFWKTTIKRGALKFEWYDPATGGTIDLKLLAWRIRPVVPAPGASPLKLWKLSMDLESVP